MERNYMNITWRSKMENLHEEGEKINLKRDAEGYPKPKCLFDGDDD